jgi:nitrite reductase (NADH) large subunit
MLKYVIIGAGIAGITAAQTLREHSPAAQITVLTDEVHPLGLYDRKTLVRRYAQGAYTEQAVTLIADDALQAQQIDMLYEPALQIFPARHEVLISHAVRLHYDALLLATGATPMIVDAPGTQYLGVHQLRNYEDISLMEVWTPELIEQGAVVIGGGILGLEAAWALRRRVVPTTLVVRDAQVGAPFLSEAAGRFIEARLQADGVNLVLNQTIVEYQSADLVILNAVKLRDDRVIPARMALCAIGVHPNTGLLEGTGVALDAATHAVRVDAHLQTTLAGVYAAGTCAQLEDGTLARHWHDSAEQGRIAALNMLGNAVQYQPAYRGNLATTLYDVPFAYFGSQAGDSWLWQTEQQFAQVWLADARIMGAALLGEATRVAETLAAMLQRGEAVNAADLRDLLQQPAQA